ncbi:MAG TPA: hypothetical protein DF383_08885, partial [Deltaproteobacteria bacterium]|nr:hypothetical protein [Deltaproteobacteria bacterium]
MSYNLFSKLSRFGVLTRTDVKNGASELQALLRRCFVTKVSKKGRVFYALTDKALPLLEDYRQLLLSKASLQYQLTPNN